MYIYIRGVTIHKSHDLGRTSVFESQFVRFFGTAGCIFRKHFLEDLDLLNCIKQMPYTHEKISNTIEDKNTKSRTSIVVLNTNHQDKTLTECDNQHKLFS